ncbi:MAG TPA: cytochrome b/b6 domain-containing protein [Thermodesulfobacteriota bacterium]|nr:cytochrome b/b6 domain-containing protein [Thermodesulfobacteriota bacterium]
MKKYFRLTLNERIQHINLFINFTILVITGFALKYPEAFWVSPLTEAPAGMTIRGFLHRLCGVATLTLGGYHLLYCAFTERGRGIIKDMIPGLKDARDFWETLKNNLYVNRPAKELKMGRFNFREKLEYFGLIWGTIVMTVTGFILWYEVEWLNYFPKWTYDMARAIHFYEAVLATLTIIVWHFYSVIFNPDVYPMSWAWITGDLTEHEMNLEHGLELEKIKAQEKRELRGFAEAAAVGGGRIYPIRREEVAGEREKSANARRFYEIVQSLNETIKNWKGT